MNLEREQIVLSYLRQARREAQWQRELSRATGRNATPFRLRARSLLRGIAQMRRLRIHVSFELRDPCPDVAPAASTKHL